MLLPKLNDIVGNFLHISEKDIFFNKEGMQKVLMQNKNENYQLIKPQIKSTLGQITCKMS